jgi:hypothetical protein
LAPAADFVGNFPDAKSASMPTPMDGRLAPAPIAGGMLQRFLKAANWLPVLSPARKGFARFDLTYSHSS